MSNHNKEIEVKFYILNLEKIEKHIQSLGALLVQPRTFEFNLRFDTPDQKLTESLQVLRLRKDSENRLTYKGPGGMVDGVQIREEIEFTVSDFDQAKIFLEALDYHVMMVYEKYRTTYNLDDILVTLDEMPFGNFIEVEGPSGDSIKRVSLKIGLNWEERILDNYDTLFRVVRKNLNLVIENLSFSDFSEIEISPDLLGVKPADD